MNEEIINNGSSFLFNKYVKIKINFYSFDEKLLYENDYLIERNIKEVKEDFLKNCLEENKFKISESQDYDNNNFVLYSKDKDKLEELNDNKKIQDIIFNSSEKRNKIGSMDTNSFLDCAKKIYKIYVKYKKFYYDKISSNMEEYIIKNTYLIGRPIINEYKYYLYEKKEEKFKIIKYQRDQRKKLKIRTFLGIDSYCNAINKLYIYEGNSDYNNMKENSENNNNFIKIDLITNNISIISSKFPKRILHSMIFIPESYIFIIGGKKLKNALVYKIQDNNENYEEYPHQLPYEILEPSLIYLNNKYLYAFENSSLDFHILRIDLIKSNPFEEIKFKNNKYDINQKFFGVINNNNSIIFYGGQMLDLFNNKSNKCFNFNYNDEIVERCDIEFKPFEFMEKVFIPIQKGSYFQIAEYKDENKYKPKKVFFNVQSNKKISLLKGESN